jgi:hypothetical protein
VISSSMGDRDALLGGLCFVDFMWEPIDRRFAR